MFAKHHYILLGILSLCLSYILFTNQQYFSLLSMLGLFVLALVAVAFFLVPHIYPDKIHDKRIFFALCAILLITGLFEYMFDLIPPNLLPAFAHEAILLAISVAFSVIGIHLLSKRIQKQKDPHWYAYAIVGAVVIAFIAYSVMYIFNTVQWNGVDEVAYNYYAAYLFTHGQNPYSISMQAIASQYNISPTIQLNGIYEYAYDYPAMSFLPFIIIPLLGITNLLSFTYLTILFTVFSALLLYRKSNLNKYLLIPLAGWIIASYALIGVASQYLAVPIFLLLAYFYREKPIASGILMGLGASTIQLTWFALPFFLILIFKEGGIKRMAKSAVSAIIVFVAINAYFVLLNPVALFNIFGLFGLTSGLVFYGINIMQFALVFYALPYWYAVFLAVLFFALMLVLFYFYTNTLKPLPAIVPMMLFFLSWRNIVIYALPFIPLLLAIYYWSDHHKHKDMLKNKKYIPYSIGAVAIIGIIVAIFAHQSYATANSLQISSIVPIIGVQNGYYSQAPVFGLIGIKATLENNLNTTQNVSFYVVSRSPYGGQYFLSQSLNKSAAHSSSNYTLTYPLQLIGQSTQIEVFAFSQNYITSKQLNFTTLGSGFSQK